MSTQSLIPMFSGDGQNVYVTNSDGLPGSIPADQLQEALKPENGYKLGVPADKYDAVLKAGGQVGVHVTSRDGKDGVIPSHQVGDALKPENGYKLGPSYQQDIPEEPMSPGLSGSALDKVRAANDARPLYKKILGLPADEQTRQAEVADQQQPIEQLLGQHLHDISGPVRGSATAVKGLADTPGAVYKAVATSPQNAAETQEQALSGRGGLALQRLLANPINQEFEKGQQLRKQGRTVEGLGHEVAAPLAPLGVGSIAEDIGKDPGAGLAELFTYAAAPEVLKESAKVLPKALPEGVRPTTILAKGASTALGGGPEAMAEKPIPQQTAAGQATNADVTNYAASKGIELLPGQATGSRGLKSLQAVGERAVIGDAGLNKHLDTQRAQFGKAVDDLKQRVAPTTPDVVDTETAGQNLKEQAQAGLDNLKSSAQADYQAFQNSTGDIPVDLSDVKTKYAAKLADQAEALRNVPPKYANPIRNVLNKLSSIRAGEPADPKILAAFNRAVEEYGLHPEQQAQLRAKLGLPEESTGVKMSTAQQLRSAYLDIARDYSGNVPKSVQRIAGEAAKDIDGAMAKAADQVGATEQWRQANAKWKQLQEVYNSPDSPLYKILQEPDPTKVPGRVLGKGNYGGSPQVVRQLKETGIDLSPLKREVVQQIADKSFKLTNGGRGMAGYSTEFLQSLFSPAEFQELQMMGRVGRAINFEMNPSGTSNVQAGERQLHGILARSASAVVSPFAAKATMSKALRKATMGSATEPPIAGMLRGESPATGEFKSKKTGGSPAFSTDERIQGIQFRISELKRERERAPAEQQPDYDAAIARELALLGDLRNKKGAAQPPIADLLSGKSQKQTPKRRK